MSLTGNTSGRQPSSETMSRIGETTEARTAPNSSLTPSKSGGDRSLTRLERLRAERRSKSARKSVQPPTLPQSNDIISDDTQRIGNTRQSTNEARRVSPTECLKAGKVTPTRQSPNPVDKNNVDEAAFREAFEEAHQVSGSDSDSTKSNNDYNKSSDSLIETRSTDSQSTTFEVASDSSQSTAIEVASRSSMEESRTLMNSQSSVSTPGIPSKNSKRRHRRKLAHGSSTSGSGDTTSSNHHSKRSNNESTSSRMEQSTDPSAPGYLLSPASSRVSMGSQMSLLGQQFLSQRCFDPDAVNDAPGIRDFSASGGSMAYSEVSSSAEKSTSMDHRDFYVVTQSRRRNSLGSLGATSNSSSLSSKSRSKHSKKKPRRGSYNGAMLQLVEQMHGSGSTTLENNQDSFNTSVSSKSQPKLQTISHPRSDDYFSSASSSSSLFFQGDGSASTFNSGTKKGHHRRHSYGASSPNRSEPKKIRRGSLNSVGSASTKSSRDQATPRRDKSPRPRRVSLSSVIKHSPKKKGGSVGSASSYGSSRSSRLRTPKESATKQRNAVEGYLPHNDMETEEEEPNSFSSLATNMSIEDAKDLIDKLDGTKGPVAHREIRTSSPVRTNRLKLSDLESMRYSAPPRLDRIRSARRRTILLSHQPNWHLPQGPDSTPTDRVTLSKLVDQLSIDLLDDLNHSGSTLPPLVPATPGTPSTSNRGSSRRKSRTSLGKPPLDPKAKTVRTSNRTIDNELEGSTPRRRRSSSASPSLRRRNLLIGAPPFLLDDSSYSSSTSSYSLDDSSYRRPFRSEQSESSHWTYSSAGSRLPPRPPAPRESNRSLSSHSSVSSLSHASSKSTGGDSQSTSTTSSDLLELPTLTRVTKMVGSKSSDSSHRRPTQKGEETPELGRIDSRVSTKTGTSETTYDLHPAELSVPGSLVASHSSTHGSGSGEMEEVASPKRMISMASARTGVSTATYDLQPVFLPVPSSPGSKSSSSPKDEVGPPSRISSLVSAKSTSSEITMDLGNTSPESPPKEMGKVSDGDSFARHGRSIDMDLIPSAPSPVFVDLRKRVASPTKSPQVTSSMLKYDAPSPIWRKLELEKKRQKELRNRLLSQTP